MSVRLDHGEDTLDEVPASTAEAQPRPERPLYLTLKSDLTLALGDNPVSRELLPGTLDAAATRPSRTAK
jgi:biopolymer transport protein ExbD